MSRTIRAKRFTPAGFLLAAVAGVVGAGGLTLRAQTVGHGISAALIKVVQNDESNNAVSVTVSTTLSINEFSIRPGSSRGDYNVQIGPGFSDDVNTGVLLSCIADNGRDNSETNY